MDDNRTNVQQPQQDVATAADSGEQGRTFTQDDVNQIVSDRLTRERAKNEPTPQELKEKELSARESRIACREYISENRYPVELLELFPTEDVENFKTAIKNLGKAFPHLFDKPTGITVSTGGLHGAALGDDEGLSQAFTKGRM